MRMKKREREKKKKNINNFMMKFFLRVFTRC